MRTVILSVAGALVLAIVGAAAWFALSGGGPAKLPPEMLNVAGASIGGPFELTDSAGRKVASEELIDGPTLIYFGYTWCPDICPVDSQKMADTTDILAERGIELTPVFITVDPARDTPRALGEWAKAVHPSIIGLTGTPEAIRKVADEFKVFYQKVENPDSPGEYTMNHTSFFYLMTPEKGLTAMFRDSATPKQMADDIENVLASL